MNVIWKTELYVENTDENNKIYVDLPVFSKILHIDLQNGLPCAWFVCDPKNKDEKESVTIVVLGTGHDFETLSVGEHLGTVLMHHGALVLHFFKPGIQRTATNDQIAAVMLQRGTPAQQMEAFGYLVKDLEP